MQQLSPRDEAPEVSTQRLEAFSDGVFAIAITLLILEIRLPPSHEAGGGASLFTALLEIWPSYLAYILSFVMIGIYWANHHYIARVFVKTSHAFNLLNVFFLMCISFLPFPTALLGKYILDPAEQRTAAVFYAFGLLLPAFAWMVMWLYGSYQYRLITPTLAPEFVRFLTWQFILSNALYLGAIVIAYLNPIAGLVVCMSLTLLYMLPPRRPVYVA